MRVLLLAGGWSPERAVSLRGAEQIAAALRSLDHDVTQADLSDVFADLPRLAASHDVAFLNLHGSPGEDGLIQAMLDRLGLPYQGSSPAGSFLALNKAASKVLFRNAGLQTPNWLFLPARPEAGWLPNLSFPLFAKSNTGGSSLHLARVEDAAGLAAALDDLFAAGQEVLLEPLIPGREATCGVLGEGETAYALPPVLIVPKTVFFDYHQKYAADGAEEICPAPLPEDTIRRMQAMAATAHQALGLRDYSRSDFILQDDGELFLLEVNTLPGMTGASLIPKEAAAVGLGYPQLVEKLLLMAMARKGATPLDASCRTAS